MHRGGLRGRLPDPLVQLFMHKLGSSHEDVRTEGMGWTGKRLTNGVPGLIETIRLPNPISNVKRPSRTLLLSI